MKKLIVLAGICLGVVSSCNQHEKEEHEPLTKEEVLDVFREAGIDPKHVNLQRRSDNTSDTHALQFQTREELAQFLEEEKKNRERTKKESLKQLSPEELEEYQKRDQ